MLSLSYHLPIIILALCFIFILIELWGYYRFFRSDKCLSASETTSATHAVSVLLLCPPGSDSTMVLRSLDALLLQAYVQAEIHILSYKVDDALTAQLQGYTKAVFPIRHTTLPQTMKNVALQKMAITIGTKSARYNTIVMTQAGVVPQTEDWLKQMAEGVSQQSAYSAPTFLSPTLKGYSALHYLYTILGLSLLQQNQRLATEQNFAYAKGLFIENRKLFSQHLDKEGGEAAELLHSAHLSNASTHGKVTMGSYNYQDCTADTAVVALQNMLSNKRGGATSAFSRVMWLGRVMWLTLALLLAYVICRMVLDSAIYDALSMTLEVLVGVTFVASVLAHRAWYKRLSRRLGLGGYATLAYWHTLMLPFTLYSYTRLRRGVRAK